MGAKRKQRVASLDVYRGHRIIKVGHNDWTYADTGEPTLSDPFRECGHCNLPNREDDHDACLGEIPGLMNACCGHGVDDDAYVQFSDGSVLQGDGAIGAARCWAAVKCSAPADE